MSGQWVTILDSHLMEGTVILNQSKGTVFLFDEENR